jgi:hypothetical protein
VINGRFYSSVQRAVKSQRDLLVALCDGVSAPCQFLSTIEVPGEPAMILVKKLSVTPACGTLRETFLQAAEEPFRPLLDELPAELMPMVKRMVGGKSRYACLLPSTVVGPGASIKCDETLFFVDCSRACAEE